LAAKQGFRGDGCRLSEVRFVSLPAMTFLAIRHHGDYADLPVPFMAGDSLWNGLVEFAKRNRITCRPLPFLICYDDPTMTPGALQRADACIAVNGALAAVVDDRIRRLDFAGGRYAGIEHAGPLATIEQAYWTCADGIRRHSDRYVFDVGPPLQIYRGIHIGGDPSANLTEVYFPIRLT
jgi:DNA gyrase inhibitor GyrI